MRCRITQSLWTYSELTYSENQLITNYHYKHKYANKNKYSITFILAPTDASAAKLFRASWFVAEYNVYKGRN